MLLPPVLQESQYSIPCELRLAMAMVMTVVIVGSRGCRSAAGRAAIDEGVENVVLSLADMVCADEVDGEEDEGEVECAEEEVDGDGGPAVAAGEGLQAASEGGVGVGVRVGAGGGGGGIEAGEGSLVGGQKGWEWEWEWEWDC